MVESIRDYWINKVFFPKVVIINKPGIIYNILSRKYSKRQSKRRILWYFEDIIANLQLKTIKKIGVDGTKELWYKIGKDHGTRYMSLNKLNKPIPKFLVLDIIKYVLKSLNAGGMSAAANYKYDHGRLHIWGKNSIVCRKTDVCEYNGGFISGIMGCILGTNIESKCISKNHTQNCHIVLDKNIPKKYIPNKELLSQNEDYETINFPKYEIKTDLKSFNDFMRFKKISPDSSGKITLFNLYIIPYGAGIMELITKNYEEINQLNLLKKVVIKESENIAKKINLNKKRKIENLMSALGWGIMNINIGKVNIIITIRKAAMSKFSPLFQILTIQGFLNNLTKKKIDLENFKTYPSSSILKILFKSEG